MLNSLAVFLVVSAALIGINYDNGQVENMKTQIKQTEATIDHLNEAAASYFIDHYPYATSLTYPAITINLLQTTTIPGSTVTYLNPAFVATLPQNQPISITTDAAGIHLVSSVPNTYLNRIKADKNGTIILPGPQLTSIQFDKAWPTSPRDNHLYRLDGTQSLTANFAGGGFSLLNINNVAATGTVSGIKLQSGVGGVQYTGDATVVSGGACVPNGLTKTNANGELFSCKAGLWLSTSGSGTYQSSFVIPSTGITWDGSEKASVISVPRYRTITVGSHCALSFFGPYLFTAAIRVNGGRFQTSLKSGATSARTWVNGFSYLNLGVGHYISFTTSISGLIRLSGMQCTTRGTSGSLGSGPIGWKMTGISGS